MILAGCSPVGMATGAGAYVGLAAFEERGFSQSMTDKRIALAIFDGWLKADEDLPTSLAATVHEGRVLVTGALQDEDLVLKAIALAWAVPGVEVVINEIQPVDTGLLDLTRDTWIETQLRGRLLVDGDVLAINYAYDVSGGVVYLIGIAQSEGELDRVVGHASEIGYVRGVINHVRIKDDAG